MRCTRKNSPVSLPVSSMRSTWNVWTHGRMNSGGGLFVAFKDRLTFAAHSLMKLQRTTRAVGRKGVGLLTTKGEGGRHDPVPNSSA